MLGWCVMFFFNDTATTEIYTLSLHDALPISNVWSKRQALGTSCAACTKSASSRPIWESGRSSSARWRAFTTKSATTPVARLLRSEEHTSELQSRQYLVCRLLLEKKKKHKLSK